MRTHTPPRRTETGTTYTMQRACNGCCEEIGDVTEQEVDAAIAGLPLPDVRGECPRCKFGTRYAADPKQATAS